MIRTATIMALSILASSAAADPFMDSVTDFIARETAAHLADVKTLDPPQERVSGALTTGEFSWGTFLRTVAATSELTGETTIAGKDVAKFIGQAGLIEARAGGKTFAQLYASLALRRFGLDLSNNAVWLSLNDTERTQWKSLLDPARFYDAKTRKVINLPENYLGVLSRIVATDARLGLITDQKFIDDVLDRAAAQITANNELYCDDDPPHGRYDRYSQEYVRYLYLAAEDLGRKDLMQALTPSLARQYRLWWDLLQTNGYAYVWGRSQGSQGFIDTMEIAAFLAAHKDLRPAGLAELAAAYRAAWTSVIADYAKDRHQLDDFRFGIGHYSYVDRTREWQQTVGFLGKVAAAHSLMKSALAAEPVADIRSAPVLPPVTRFEWFRKDGPYGIWVVRQGRMQFALPIVTGTMIASADYAPAPHGLTGIAAPVAVATPAFAPFLELADGTIIAATSCVIETRPSADAQTLTVRWRACARVGGKITRSGEHVATDMINTGLTMTAEWRLSGDHLTRKSRIESARAVKIRRFAEQIPSTASDDRDGRFLTPDGTLSVTVTSSTKLTRQLHANGDSPMGKGALAAIPLTLELSAADLEISPGHPLDWTITLTVAN